MAFFWEMRFFSYFYRWLVAISKTFITPKNLRLDTHEKKSQKVPFLSCTKSWISKWKTAAFLSICSPLKKKHVIYCSTYRVLYLKIIKSKTDYDTGTYISNPMFVKSKCILFSNSRKNVYFSNCLIPHSKTSAILQTEGQKCPVSMSFVICIYFWQFSYGTPCSATTLYMHVSLPLRNRVTSEA